MFKLGGLNLRKWSSNSQAILEHVTDDLRETKQLQLNGNEVQKTLGVYWATSNDTIKFKVNFRDIRVNQSTKGTLMSNVAKLFDPLGLLSPIVIVAKLIIQELWREQCSWDNVGAESIAIKWRELYMELKQLEEIKIPRWVHTSSAVRAELHGFCDASEKALGAVIYVRTTNELGDIKISLLVSRSKVAPIKTKPTLPRLELCGALLLTKLIKRVRETLGSPNWKTHAWPHTHHSMITFSWIQSEAGHWKTFVANRVSEIRHLIRSTMASCWVQRQPSTFNNKRN